MDLLKDITRELRGGTGTAEGENGSRSGGNSRHAPTARADAGRGDSSAKDGASAAADEPTEGTDSLSDGDSLSDVHVCSFCETEFDASSSVCPECDAEIVLRGER